MELNLEDSEELRSKMELGRKKSDEFGSQMELENTIQRTRRS